MTKKKKVIHLPYNVGNQSFNISRGERKLGFDSDTMEFIPSQWNYSTDYCLKLQDMGKYRNLFTRTKFLVYSLLKYDIFHFYYADTFFLNMMDLKILKKFGKKIFFTFQGCDLRLDHSRAFRMCNQCAMTCRDADAVKKLNKLKLILKYADETFCLNPDLMEFSPSSKFLPYASCDVESINPVDLKIPNDKPLRIMHTPSDRLKKGTPFLINAVENLKKRGFEIELVLVENVTNAEVFEIGKTCHLVCDQLLAGWYGGFSVEMMALGLPVIAFVEEEQIIKSGLKDIPIIRTDSEIIESTLEEILKNKESLPEIGKCSREYALRIHSPVNVAKIITQFY